MRLNQQEIAKLAIKSCFKPSDFVNLLDTCAELIRERDEARDAATEEIESWQAKFHAKDIELDQSRAELALAEAAIAAAFREAAQESKDWLGDGSGLYDEIIALTPATAIRAEKRLVAQVRLETLNDLIKATHQYPLI